MANDDPFKEFGGKPVEDTDPFSQFGGTELKKKPLPKDGESTSRPSVSGLAPSLPSQENTSNPIAPSILLGEARKRAEETLKRRKIALAAAPQKEEAKGGAGSSFMGGLNQFNESLFKIPRYLYDLAAIPQNFISEITNTPELAADYDTIAQGKVNPLGVADRIGDYYSDQSKNYLDKVQKYDKGVYESLTNGNWKDAGAQVLNNIAQSAPSIGGMYLTGGVGNAAKLSGVGKTFLTALPFASGKNAELQEREDVPNYVKPINSTLNGLAEVVFDQEFGTKAILDNVIHSFQKEGRDAAVALTKDFIKGYAEKALRKVQPLTSAVKNSLEEMSTQLSQNIVDKATIDPEKDLTDGLLDAGIIGGVTGGGIQTIGSGLSGIYNSKQKGQLSEAVQRRNDLVTDLDNAELDDNVKAEIARELERTNETITNLSEEAESKLSILPESEQNKATELQKRIADIEGSLSNESLSEGTRQALESQLTTAQDKLDLIAETSDKLREELESQVIQKAETDLESLKQVTDKVKKYEASMKRLTDAKNQGHITNKQFDELKQKFDEVIGQSDVKPKEELYFDEATNTYKTRTNEKANNETVGEIPDGQEIGQEIETQGRVEEGTIGRQESPEIVQQENEVADAIQESEPTESVLRDEGIRGEGQLQPVVEGNPQEQIAAPEGEILQEEVGTAIKNADIAQKREELGLEPRESVERISNPETVAEAKRLITSDQFDPQVTISKVLDEGKSLDRVEQTALKLYQLAKEDELVNLNNDISQRIKDGLPVDTQLAQRDILLTEADNAFRASEGTGTIAARALQARQIQLLNDFSLTGMLLKKRQSLGDKKLTPEQYLEVEEQYRKIKELNDQLQAKVDDLEKRSIDTLSEDWLKKQKREEKKLGRVKQREALQKEIEDTLADFKRKIKEQRSTLSANPIPAEALGDVVKLAKLYSQMGLNSLGEIADKIRDDLSDTFEGLSSDDVRAVLANDEYAKSDSRLKGYKARTRSRIEDLRNRTQSGDFSKKIIEPIKLDKEGEELQYELRKAKREFDLGLERDKLATRSKFEKGRDIATEVLNTPRAIMASIDFSAPLRQGVILTVSNPKQAVGAMGEMFKQAFSQKRFDQWIDDLKESSEYAVMENAGLYIADPHKPNLIAKEEQFMSNIAEKVPVIGKLVKGSERAYVAYLNKLRADVFMQGQKVLEDQGITPQSNPKEYEALAKMINTFTGRGSLGKSLETSAPILNSAFFSPRLMAARLQSLNPQFYANMPAPVRKMALKDMATFLAFGTSILALAALSGADVEKDPRSTDFGKIRVGDTRWDIWGGFQQYVRFFAQFLSGQTKSTTTKKVKDLDPKKFPFKSRGDLPFTFLRSKLAPVPAMGLNLLYGSDVMGQEYTYEDIPKSFFPLLLQDTKKILDDQGGKGILTGMLPATFGVGVQVYDNTSSKQEAPKKVYR